jgi:hydroxylamine oxidation protein HaoB
VSFLKKYGLPVVGVLFIASGLWVAWFGLPDFSSHELQFEKTLETRPGQAGFPALQGKYPVESLAEYAVRQGDSVSLKLDAVQYRKNADELRQALVYLPDDVAAATQIAPPIKAVRRDLWQEAMQAINQHTDEQTLFLSWWDNAQRIDFFTGRATWASLPLAAAFKRPAEQALWWELTGPFDKDETRLHRLAGWLTMDASLALQDMAAVLPAGQAVYFLVCVDDLARLSEIEKLSGKKLGFEARMFPQSADIHSQIAEVRSWASESGTGSYLLQTVPGQGLRAWRIADAATENSLFAKMMPFTSSLVNPPQNLELVYQSNWGAYLNIYHWVR